MINVVITSGGTSERIDNVRKITNSSSGKLGSVISDKLNELLHNTMDYNSRKPIQLLCIS